MVEVHVRHFFIWEHVEESLKKFLNKLSSFHPTIKFNSEYYEKKKVFDVSIRLLGGAHEIIVW